MRYINVGLILCAFLLIRPDMMADMGLMYPGDDYDYMAHATALTYGAFPSYADEFDYGDTGPKGSIGTGLLALPFTALFSCLDRMAGSTITVIRTRENVLPSWTLFGFVVGTGVYFWCACLLLYRALRSYYGRRTSALTVLLMALTQGMPLFVFRRPVFSHAYEFFLQSVMVAVLLHVARNPAKARRQAFAVGIGLVTALIFLVRMNNLPIALTWLILLLVPHHAGSTAQRLRGLAVGSAVFLVIIGVFKVWPMLAVPRQGYPSAEAFGQFAPTLDLMFYVRRLGYILWGADWGLLYTGPFLLLGLGALVFMRSHRPIRHSLGWCLLPMLVTLYGVVMFGSQGGYYGYRYLFPSLIPLLVFPFAGLLQKVKRRPGLLALVLLVAVIPSVSMLAFEGNMSSWTLALNESRFGRVDWIHEAYQLSVWKSLIAMPDVALVWLFRGGPLAVHFLLSRWFPGWISPSVTGEASYHDVPAMVWWRALALCLLPLVASALAMGGARFVGSLRSRGRTA